jgi:competence protein ComEA
VSSPEIVPAPRSRVRIGLGAAVVLVLLALGVSIAVAALGSHGETTVISRSSPRAWTSPVPGSTGNPSASGSADEIYVHVLGQVTKPGLYVLRDGDRAVDAVAAAGGYTATADRTQLNLARPLVDGEQIVVPAQGEAPAASGAPVPGSSGAKVNLNTADETALETLPRVGPALAGRILDWRKTNGRFTSVQDLMSVSGIGQKTFDGLKDLVTV